MSVSHTDTQQDGESAGVMLSIDNRLKALGEIISLMSQSEAHSYFFISDLDWFILPPLKAGQLRVFRHANRAVGFAVWAMVSEQVENRLKAGHVKLRPDEWVSGDRPWVLDIVIGRQASNGSLLNTLVNELAVGPLASKGFSMLLQDAKTGTRKIRTVGPKRAATASRVDESIV